MNLWVRSQDKENLILIKNPICVYDNKIIYKESASYIITIAEYKTKERALEVLDEIQKLLKPTIITTGYECELKENIKDKTSFNLDMIPTKTEIQELSTFVYQMPER